MNKITKIQKVRSGNNANFRDFLAQKDAHTWSDSAKVRSGSNANFWDFISFFEGHRTWAISAGLSGPFTSFIEHRSLANVYTVKERFKERISTVLARSKEQNNPSKVGIHQSLQSMQEAYFAP
jgi:hypothetical protein